MEKLSKRTILLVEDETLTRMDVSDILSDAGFNVVEAHNADTALNLINMGLSFDILVTDVDMPGVINGLDLASRIAGTLDEVSIVVMSGRISNASEIPTGAVFLSKPFGPDTLESMIEIAVLEGSTRKRPIASGISR